MTRSQLFITDLDGTLLQNDATLSEFARSALQQMLAQGVMFTIASARSVFSIQDILGDLPIQLPIVSVNGGYISDLSNGRHLSIQDIQSDLAEQLLNLIVEKGFSPWVSTYNGTEDRLYYNRIANGGMQWYLEDRQMAEDPRLQYMPHLEDALTDYVICLIVMGRKKPLASLRSTIEAEYGDRLMTQFYENRYSLGWHWLSIHDASANKGRAVRALVDRCGLQDTELFVFGDAENDIDMFREADHAIAVAGAEDLLKPHATQIIGSNSDDSVVRFIADTVRSRTGDIRN